ncbi:hypothetical protein CP967_21865 [Streptomyces nitrosporeus]|uniref:Lipoprotein n=1 Tax=Streptomyces nitrosporeus TaxID=28894 RepID=A0A5J6FD13_9ACTN|nr:hypothetical protein [Streptomyces nitrosporeus]QEU74288.1 hypothetical protein CP967_21865 [Streptomyces nitrosporeus]GGY96701.1 hypothetical protein GCM10010327_29120 [Streptomyces nitrosporeus]
MSVRTVLRAAIPAIALGACLAGCSLIGSTPEPAGAVPGGPGEEGAVAADTGEAERADGAADPSVTATPGPGTSGPGTGAEGDGLHPERVRDAFAGLQATLNETCTPGAGDCAYFLGRVHQELNGLDAAMKADGQGPDHFKEPPAWMGTLRTTLGDDVSTPNLEKHFDDLVGTRDRINTWMQGHPEDYR